MIRVANELDLSDIYKIELDNFENPWKINQFRVYINNSNAINVIFECDNIVKAYIFGEIIDEEYHLYKISVHKSNMNQGIGSQLLDYLIKYLKDISLLYIYLEVKSSNLFAKKLYQNFGFKKINIRKNYYNYCEDALLYNLSLE